MPKKTATCEICRNPFTYYSTNEDGRFCSQKCLAVSRWGAGKRYLLTPEYLHQRYVLEGASSIQIAAELETSKPTVLRYLRIFGIKRRKPKGWTTTPQGYVLIKQPDHPHANQLGYVLEHRLVMENKIGRYLTPEEVVHHLNKIPWDNRPENLELASDHSSHMIEHHYDPERYRRMQAGGAATKRARHEEWLASLLPIYCECGCGNEVPITTAHTPAILPRMLRGHGKRAVQDPKFQAWLKEHEGLRCACGCGTLITLTRNHFRHHILPKFVHGHNARKPTK